MAYPAQIIGDQKKMSNAPKASPSANPQSGAWQMIGDKSKLGMNPVASPSANPSGGESQIIGETSSLNRTPVKGWGSAANVPMSDRAVAQSKTAAGGGKK